MPAARLADLREHVETCRELLAGKTTAYQEGQRRRMVQFLNPQRRLDQYQEKSAHLCRGEWSEDLRACG